MWTWGPTTQKGPIETPGSSSAEGSTIAEGWIIILTCVSTPATASPFYRYQSVTAGYGLPITGDQGIAQLRLHDDLAIDPGHPANPSKRASVLHELDLRDQGITRNHRPPEAHLVHPGKVGQLALVAGHRKQDHSPHLGHRLQQQHPRHHRMARKMTLKETLVQRHVLQTHGPPARFQLEDAVHQQ